MINRLLKILSYSNVWIAFAAAINCFVYGSNTKRSFELAVLVFFSTLFLYNFQRLWLLPYPLNSSSERHNWIETHKKGLKRLTLLAFVMCFNALRILSYSELVVGLILLTLGVLYSYFPWQKPLRNFGWLKTILVTMVWVFVVFFFEDIASLWSHPLPALRLALLVYLLTLMFEYRDKNTDATLTLAQMLPKKSFAVLLVVINAVVIGADVCAKDYYLLSIDAIVLPVLVYCNFTKRNDFFYSFYVDGYLILSAVFYALK